MAQFGKTFRELTPLAGPLAETDIFAVSTPDGVEPDQTFKLTQTAVATSIVYNNFDSLFNSVEVNFPVLIDAAGTLQIQDNVAVLNFVQDYDAITIGYGIKYGVQEDERATVLDKGPGQTLILTECSDAAFGTPFQYIKSAFYYQALSTLTGLTVSPFNVVSDVPVLLSDLTSTEMKVTNATIDDVVVTNSVTTTSLEANGIFSKDLGYIELKDSLFVKDGKWISIAYDDAHLEPANIGQIRATSELIVHGGKPLNASTISINSDGSIATLTTEDYVFAEVGQTIELLAGAEKFSIIRQLLGGNQVGIIGNIDAPVTNVPYYLRDSNLRVSETENDPDKYITFSPGGILCSPKAFFENDIHSTGQISCDILDANTINSGSGGSITTDDISTVTARVSTVLTVDSIEAVDLIDKIVTVNANMHVLGADPDGGQIICRDIEVTEKVTTYEGQFQQITAYDYINAGMISVGAGGLETTAISTSKILSTNGHESIVTSSSTGALSYPEQPYVSALMIVDTVILPNITTILPWISPGTSVKHFIIVDGTKFQTQVAGWYNITYFNCFNYTDLAQTGAFYEIMLNLNDTAPKRIEVRQPAVKADASAYPGNGGHFVGGLYHLDVGDRVNVQIYHNYDPPVSIIMNHESCDLSVRLVNADVV